jgi:hypothetical protein
MLSLCDRGVCHVATGKGGPSSGVDGKAMLVVTGTWSWRWEGVEGETPSEKDTVRTRDKRLEIAGNKLLGPRGLSHQSSIQYLSACRYALFHAASKGAGLAKRTN